MKNLILFFPFLIFVACRNVVENKEKTCPQYEKGSREYLQDSMRQGLDGSYLERGNLNKVVDMNAFDTIYRYRGHGGWGTFDYICSIYKQLDTPQYKVQLLRKRGSQDTMYDISEKNLDLIEWQSIKKKFEESNFWCYGIGKENYDTDSNHYDVSAKEEDRKRHVFWEEKQDSYDTLRGLGMDMLELADYPLPYALLYCKKVRDSIILDIVPIVIDYSLVKNYSIRTIFKGGIMNSGAYQLKIHKKDFDKIDNIEMEVEFYNGKIRRTNEKKIEKVNF